MSEAITLKKPANLGNTFRGLVAAAFGCDRQIRIDPLMQHGNCGTIEVDGVAYDWSVRGDEVAFFEAK